MSVRLSLVAQQIKHILWVQGLWHMCGMHTAGRHRFHLPMPPKAPPTVTVNWPHQLFAMACIIIHLGVPQGEPGLLQS